MVVYCVEFILRPDGKLDAQQYFGQHFEDDELLGAGEPCAPYEDYQVTGESILLPKAVLREEEKVLWLEVMQGKNGDHDPPYNCRRAI